MSDTKYLDISIDCVVFGFDDEQLKILLIEQNKIDDEHVPLKALPGDLVQHGEDLDEAAARVLHELTNIEGLFLKQFGAFGHPERVRGSKDQKWLRQVRENPDAHIVTIGYYSLVRMEDFKPVAASFAHETEWIDVYEIPELAFDHNIIIEQGLERLREDTQNNDISFELLPKKFTLGQLQKLHEMILDKKLDKRNFRKSVKKLDDLIALNEKQKGVFHKPAQLYTFERGDK